VFDMVEFTVVLVNKLSEFTFARMKILNDPVLLYPSHAYQETPS
jgi:hypothetical protein